MYDDGDELKKLDIILECVERDCIKGGKQLGPALDFCKGWDSKYLRNFFSYVADMSLGDYVRRRRLTEAYCKIMDFSMFKKDGTIDGIRNVKTKIVKEFGEKPERLQHYLYDVVSREEIGKRLAWKQVCGLKKRRIINESKIVLFSRNRKVENRIDWDSTYVIFGDSYISLRANMAHLGYSEGKLFPLDSVVKILRSEWCPAEDSFESIFRILSGDMVRGDNLPYLLLNVHRNGGFETNSLILNYRISDNAITNVSFDNRLRVEGDELVLYLSSAL